VDELPDQAVEDIERPPPDDRRLGFRAAAALVQGAVLFAVIVGTGAALTRWWASTGDCHGDCQPQYFMQYGFVYVLAILPLTYVVGCVTLVSSMSSRLRRTGVADRIGFNVGCGIGVATIALPAYFLTAIPQRGYGPEIERRVNLGMAAIPTAPVLAAAVATMATVVLHQRRVRAAAARTSRATDQLTT